MGGLMKVAGTGKPVFGFLLPASRNKVCPRTLYKLLIKIAVAGDEEV
jgi:hypothetical protein